jgi:hypothetical protein
MGLKIRRKHVLVAVAIAAVGVMSAVTLAWAAPTIYAGTTPLPSHVADGRAARACTDCHTVIAAVPTPDPTVLPSADPTPTPSVDPTVTPSPDETVTPSPDTTGTPGPCNAHGADHGKKIGHHKGDSNNARATAHAAQKPKANHGHHGTNSQGAMHQDSREFGMAGGNGHMSGNHS